MLYNKSISDQFRFVAASRTDRHEVPNTEAQQALGIDDREVADDTLVNLTWLHTTDSGDVLTLSPYYHYNRLQYIGGPNDPLVTNDDRSSNYYGGYFSWAMTRGRHTLRFGTDSFAEHDNSFFGLQSNVGDRVTVSEHELLWAGVLSAFAEDSVRVTPWFTFNPGLRYEHFNGTLSEHGLSPRIGGAITVPHLGVVRASYSHYYQHPQTSTISGPLLELAVNEGFAFLPVPGERNEVWEVGLGVPLHGWTLDFDTYDNQAKNIVDHEVLAIRTSSSR